MPRQAKNYDAIKRKFIIWLATPDEMRLPVTQGLFAQEHGIDEGTLSDWKTPQLMAKVNELVDKHLADDYAPTVAALKRQARQGSFPHMRMYFEMIGKYVQKIAPTTPDGKEPYTLLPDNELELEIARIIDGARARAARRASE